MKHRKCKIVKVYLIYDLSGKKEGYVGQTTHKSIEIYWAKHLSSSRKRNLDGSYRSKSAKCREIRKRRYRVGFRILKTGSFSLWNVAEIERIAYYKKIGWRLWNATRGGKGNVGWVPSKITRKRIGKGNSGRKKTPQETRKRSRSLKKYYKTHEHPKGTLGWHPSKKTRELHSKHMSGKNNPMFGKHPTLKTRRKRSKSMTGFKRSEEDKKRKSRARLKWLKTHKHSCSGRKWSIAERKSRLKLNRKREKSWLSQKI